MLRLYHVVLGGVLLVLLPLGIKVVSPRLSAKSQSPQQSQTSGSTQDNVWKNLLGKTSTPSNWQAIPCQGNAPLLCISANGERLGTVEIGVYPLDQQQNFQKMLLQAGIEPGKNVDFQNPNHQNRLSSALNTWVNEHYTTLSKDRKTSYGDRITFLSHPPQKVQIGKLPGLSYGFTGLKRPDGVQEHHLGYVTFDGKALYVITTAFDPASETGKFEKLENLTVFEPYLNAIASNLKLPK